MTVPEHKKYFNRPRGYFHITSHRGGLIFIVKYVLTLLVKHVLMLYKQNVCHVLIAHMRQSVKICRIFTMRKNNCSKYIVFAHFYITFWKINTFCLQCVKIMAYSSEVHKWSQLPPILLYGGKRADLPSAAWPPAARRHAAGCGKPHLQINSRDG